MIDETKVTLPIKAAYQFGVARGLTDEIEKIRRMPIAWGMSYTTSVRRGFVIELFIEKGIFDQFKSEFWPFGNSSGGVALTNRYLAIKQRYEDALHGGSEGDPDDAAELEDAQDQAFAFESHLRDFLVKNPEHIEPGLRVYSKDGASGVEYVVDGGKGRIDILAIDNQNRFVVIELKLLSGRNKALGQLCYYMGWVDKHLGGGPCRGIIIAKEIPEELTLAVQRVPGVSLGKYSLSVSVAKMPASA